MRRVASLFLPTWPTDRLRRRNDTLSTERPLVLAARVGAARLIAAACAEAQALGLHAGLSLAHAQARVPLLDVHDADPNGEAADLARLAGWVARRYTPLVAVDSPDGLLLDITGCAHLFGDEECMLSRLLEHVRGFGVSAIVAAADAVGAAHAVARFARGEDVRIVEVGRHAAAIGPLPIAALRLSYETVEKLRRLGLSRIEHLAALPRGPLVHRFGPEVARRLDQAYGRDAEPITPLISREVPRSELCFVEPLMTADALAVALERLVEEMCTALESIARGARRLHLVFHRVDGEGQAVTAGTSRPSRDPKHLHRLLVPMLETIDPGFGIERMTLCAPLAEPLTFEQLAVGVDDGEPGSDLVGLIDRLMNRLGPTKVYRAAPVESDVPERSVRRVAPLAPPAGGNWPTPDARPSRLVDPPEPIDVIAAVPDYRPAQFVRRGQRKRIVAADGPERVYGEWWRVDGETDAYRDYWRVEDDAGARFWLFRLVTRAPDGTIVVRWYLQGVFG